MKKISHRFFVAILFLQIISVEIYAQQPYRINPANGLPLLDGSNNPIRNDKNYLPIPSFYNDFNSDLSTKLDFEYGSNLQINELSYIVLEDVGEDNCNDNCTYNIPFGGQVVVKVCNNGGFFGSSLLPYPIAHTYQFNGSASTVKLIMKKYSQDYIKGWYKNGTCNWVRFDKKFSYTKGQLISRDAFKYGYFEARFKVNRPPGISNSGLGQCFWMFPIKNPRNLQNYVSQYCYSEIDIAENQPDYGIHGFGAYVSKTDGDCPEKPDNFSTNECGCPTSCGTDVKSIFHKFVEQEEFHTYALEWTPSSLKYFYDNVLITTINNIGTNGKIPANFDPMGIILDIEGGDAILNYQGRCSEIDINTIFPFEFEIDYVKQYKLDLSQCNDIHPTIYTQSGFENFTNNPKVKAEIRVGEDGLYYPITVNGGSNVSLRAAYLIELNEGFEVDINGEFFADVIGGCDEGF